MYLLKYLPGSDILKCAKMNSKFNVDVEDDDGEFGYLLGPTDPHMLMMQPLTQSVSYIIQFY